MCHLDIHNFEILSPSEGHLHTWRRCNRVLSAQSPRGLAPGQTPELGRAAGGLVLSEPEHP